MTAVYTCKLAGLSHVPPEVRTLVQQLVAGTSLTLRRQPDNAYDPNAIMAMAEIADGKVRVGYLPRDVAAQLAPDMDSGSTLPTCTVELPMIHGEAPQLRVINEPF